MTHKHVGKSIVSSKKFVVSLKEMTGEELIQKFQEGVEELNHTRLFSRGKISTIICRLNHIKKLLIKRGYRADLKFSSAFHHRNTGEIYVTHSDSGAVVVAENSTCAQVPHTSQGPIVPGPAIETGDSLSEGGRLAHHLTLNLSQEIKENIMNIKKRKTQKAHSRPTKYSDLYSEIFTLKMGEEVLVPCGTKRARKIQAAVSVHLSRVHLSSKYKVSSKGGVLSVRRA